MISVVGAADTGFVRLTVPTKLPNNLEVLFRRGSDFETGFELIVALDLTVCRFSSLDMPGFHESVDVSRKKTIGTKANVCLNVKLQGQAQMCIAPFHSLVLSMHISFAMRGSSGVQVKVINADMM